MTDRNGYQIQIEGWIGERWAHWFEDAIVRSEQAPDGTPITTLSGIFDQAALRGLLSKIWDLNLTLLSVTPAIAATAATAAKVVPPGTEEGDK